MEAACSVDMEYGGLPLVCIMYCVVGSGMCCVPGGIGLMKDLLSVHANSRQRIGSKLAHVSRQVQRRERCDITAA